MKQRKIEKRKIEKKKEKEKKVVCFLGKHFPL
jgi:hypothetical protein